MQVPVEILWGVAGFVGIKGFEWFFGLLKKNQDEKDAAINELTETTRELRFAVKSLEEKIVDFPKLKKDVDELHGKFRQLNSKVIEQ